MIWGRVWICEGVDRFFRKPFWFPRFRVGYGWKWWHYVLCFFWFQIQIFYGKKRHSPLSFFLLCFVYIKSGIIEQVYCEILFSSILREVFRRDLTLFWFYSFFFSIDSSSFIVNLSYFDVLILLAYQWFLEGFQVGSWNVISTSVVVTFWLAAFSFALNVFDFPLILSINCRSI